MGVEPFLVASSVEAVLAQRLVRRVCASCGADWTPDWDTLPDALRFREGTVLRRGTGCRDCRGTGYHGRVGLYELLVVSDSVRKQVLAQRSTGEIAQAAVGDKNLTTLLDAGRTAVLQGLTCPDEVARVAVAGQ
jgi:type II secretory ATPase GspE/PulE/Tfp pilus assembly ATPase PilB-like protein